MSSIPPAKITTSNIDKTEKTKLKLKYSFYYRISESPQKNTKMETKDYLNQVKKIADFETIEDFWAIFQHLRKPDSCRSGIEFLLFKENIKPIWEDENNKKGGKVSIILNQGYTTIIWEEMIFALIGGVLPDKINGIVVSCKNGFNKLQIWFNVWEEKSNSDIDDMIRDLLQIPKEVTLEFKKFFD